MVAPLKRSDIPDVEIIEACRAFHRHEAPTPDKALAHKYPVKVIAAKMAHMVERGLLDYGVSLRTAWVVQDEAEMAKRPPRILPRILYADDLTWEPLPDLSQFLPFNRTLTIDFTTPDDEP